MRASLVAMCESIEAIKATGSVSALQDGRKAPNIPEDGSAERSAVGFGLASRPGDEVVRPECGGEGRNGGAGRAGHSDRRTGDHRRGSTATTKKAVG